MLTRDEVASGAAGAEYQQFLINWADTNPDNPWNERMVVLSDDNLGYAFDVSYGKNDSLNSLEVSNRRVGVVDVTANKTWTDQGLTPVTAQKRASCFPLHAKAMCFMRTKTATCT